MVTLRYLKVTFREGYCKKVPSVGYRKLFSNSLEAAKSKIKVSAD